MGIPWTRLEIFFIIIQDHVCMLEIYIQMQKYIVKDQVVEM